MEDDSDNASFLDSLISADTRRRTREQTQPLVDLVCSPVCIRSTIVTVGSALLILTTMLIAFSITEPVDTGYKESIELQSVPDWMLDHVTDDIVRMHLKTLSSDLMEGRGPGTRGEALAAEYIASHFTIAGLKPAGDNATFYQAVPMASVTPVTPAPLVLGPLTLEYPDQYTVSTDFFNSEVSALINIEMVFVGYGIVAHAYDWDDYKGIDVKNKIVVMLVNEPFDNADDSLFAGKTLTYYGRWTYKYEQARAKGAIGVMLIHTTELAGYEWQVVVNSFAGEQVMLTNPPVTNPLHFKGWITEQAADALAGVQGSSLSEWLAAADSRNFRPILLSTRFNYSVNYIVRHFKGTNVVGRLGSLHASRKDTVIMMAHHDHLGIRPVADSSTSGDTIYNGAVDNASGVAALLAAAYAMGALFKPPPVSMPGLLPVVPYKAILFITFTGEESNLLGATYFTANSTCEVPVCGATSALNFDVMNVWGATRDTVAIGYGMSTYMDKLVQEATRDERLALIPDPTPNLGHLFRSDQLPFALAHIPSLTLSAGTHFLNKPAYYYENVTQAYITQHYHQPSDEYDPTWSMAGIIQQTRVMLRIAYRLSTLDPVPHMDNSEILPPPITSRR